MSMLPVAIAAPISREELSVQMTKARKFDKQKRACMLKKRKEKWCEIFLEVNSSLGRQTWDDKEGHGCESSGHSHSEVPHKSSQCSKYRKSSDGGESIAL